MTDTSAENKQAYQEVCILSYAKGWWATYNAITEDGFDPNVNWKKMFEDFSKEKPSEQS